MSYDPNAEGEPANNRIFLVRAPTGVAVVN